MDILFNENTLLSKLPNNAEWHASEASAAMAEIKQ